MSRDKKDYQIVLIVLLSQRTIESMINKLTDSLVCTEDKYLKLHLRAVIENLNEAMRNQKKRTARISLRIDDPRYKPLITYCQACIDSIKPQWQIIAEKHGWAPPVNKM